MNKKKQKSLNELRRFFLPCEFKPNTTLFSVLEPFAYDIRPAFIYGSLGIVAYEPESFSIISSKQDQPVFGHIMTITHPETILLLDKIKGYNGPTGYNVHIRRLVHAFTDVDKAVNAWAYVMSEFALAYYEKIETIDHGIWDETDDKLLDFYESLDL